MENCVLTPQHVTLLKENPLFAAYSEADIAQLVSFCHYQQVPAGTLLFNQGDACHGFFFVLSGFIELFRTSDSNQQKKVIEFIESEHTFAEAALFSGQGYPVSACASIDSELIMIEGLPFSRFLQSRPLLMWRVLGTMSVRQHKLVAHISSLGLHSAEQKVAEYLLAQCDDESPEFRVLGLPQRRGELASRLSLSVETLCRILSNFRKRGLISEDSKQMHILDWDGLKQLLMEGK